MARFLRGNPGGPGRPPGSTGAQRKEKLAALMERVLDAGDPEEQLKKLLQDEPKEFFHLYVSLMPKDRNINARIERNIPPEQLQQAIDFVVNFASRHRVPSK